MEEKQSYYDFFLAHAGPDKEAAETLFDLLGPHSKVFLDTRCLKLGDDWTRELPLAQSRSLITVVLVSSQTDQAYYQREEIAAALHMARQDKEKHRVVPVFLDSNPSNEEIMPYGLRCIHSLRISNAAELPKVAESLIELLAKLSVDSKTDALKMESAVEDVYGHIENELRHLWDAFDQARFTIAGHRQGLEQLAEKIQGVANSASLDEIGSLQKAVLFESGGQADVWSLEQSLILLRSAFDKRAHLVPSARIRLSARYIQEMVRSIFYGIDTMTSEEELGRHYDHLEEVVSVVSEELEGVLADVEEPIEKAAAYLFMGEAFKELQAVRPMMNPDGTLSKSAPRLSSAEQWIRKSIDILKQHQSPRSEPPQDPKSWDRSQFLLGLAWRHLAIVCEYTALQPLDDERHRETYSDQWKSYSAQAASVLEVAKEDYARAYALMNWATTELTTRSPYDSSRYYIYGISNQMRQQLQQAVERFETAEKIMRDLGDLRGQAYAHLLRARGYDRMMLDMPGQSGVSGDDERKETLFKMYRHARRAISMSMRVRTDPIAIGLSNCYAAEALLVLTRNGIIVYRTQEEQILKIIRFAETGRSNLYRTHRRIAIARCEDVKAEALYLLADEPSRINEKTTIIAQAVAAKTEAFRVLSDSMELDPRSLSKFFVDLTRIMGPALSRAAL